jgi:D-alanyl-D-alanine carboxypeptidase (penicillin-binding protein 5/6)
VQFPADPPPPRKPTHGDAFAVPHRRPGRVIAAGIAAGLIAAGLIASGLPASAPAAAASRPAQAAAPSIPLRPAASGRPRHIRARGAEVMNAVTGQRLWSRNLNRRKPMGSITKVMTALVVIRAGHLEQRITITKAIPAYIRRHPDASSAGLRAGDVLTARQLLEAMLVPSGCDAALALARAYGPGRRAFVQKMNAAARQLGMTRTHFSNFDGMPLPTEHSTYSTPADLMILGRAAMQLAPFRRIVRQQSHALARTAAHHAYYWLSTNLLLGAYPGTVGIKTGSTRAAGYCLLFEATVGGTTLIGVVLHSSGSNPFTRFKAAARLLNWGFGTAVALPRRPAAPIRD